MDRKHPRETIVGKPVFMLKVFSKYLIGCCVEQRVNIGGGRLSCLTMKLHHVFDSLMGRSTSVHQIEGTAITYATRPEAATKSQSGT